MYRQCAQIHNARTCCNTRATSSGTAARTVSLDNSSEPPGNEFRRGVVSSLEIHTLGNWHQQWLEIGCLFSSTSSLQLPARFKKLSKRSVPKKPLAEHRQRHKPRIENWQSISES